MQTEKQKWVEDALRSIDGAASAKAPVIIDRVMSRIENVDSYSIAPASDNSLVWKIAASIALLLLLNGVTIYSYQGHMPGAEKKLNIQAEASDLGLGQSSNDPGAVIFGN